MATTKLFLLVIALVLHGCLAVEDVAKKNSLLEVLAELNMTSLLDGLKKCGIDRTINHEGKHSFLQVLISIKL